MFTRRTINMSDSMMAGVGLSAVVFGLGSAQCQDSRVSKAAAVDRTVDSAFYDAPVVLGLRRVKVEVGGMTFGWRSEEDGGNNSEPQQSPPSCHSACLLRSSLHLQLEK